MAQPYVGEIRMFAGNFAPAGWMFCHGALLQISANETLFQLIGTTYGGNGQTEFALPDLRSRVPIHQGTGPGLSLRNLAVTGGVEQVTLTVAQMVAHNHALLASASGADNRDPAGHVYAEAIKRFYTGPSAPVAMAASSMTPVGGTQPHDNMQPFQTVTFIISLFGIWPSPT